jgi:L,D-transpeptidase catalytic domain/Putative peptidoglycan binding domain
MRRRLLLLASLLVILVLAGAGSVYAFDQSRQDRIAKGVRVNGVEVGGMTVDAAKAKLRRALLQPLNRPVVVRGEGHRFTLTPSQTDIGLDVDGSVDRALAASRTGDVLSRTWRELRGGTIRADVQADVTYDKTAIRRLADRAARRIDKPAVDAKLDLAGGNVSPQASHEGLAVRAGWLRSRVRDTLLSTAPTRDAIHVKTRTVKPEVTTEQLAAKYPAVLVLNRSAFTLTLYKHLKRAKSYQVAVGMVGLETPAGTYHIQNKAVNPAWTEPNSDWVAAADRGKVVPGGTAENPLKARWLGIFNGAGIHGIDPSEYGSIGHQASHGCVRMRIPDVIDLYPQVPVGAPIYIG